MILGKISAVDDLNGLQLIIDGEETPTTKKYSYVSSYVPTANDRVLIEEIGGSYVIMGKVINDTASSGIAREATNAVNAQNLTGATGVTGKLITAIHNGYDPSIGYFINKIDTVDGTFLKI